MENNKKERIFVFTQTSDKGERPYLFAISESKIENITYQGLVVRKYIVK